MCALDVTPNVMLLNTTSLLNVELLQKFQLSYTSKTRSKSVAFNFNSNSGIRTLINQH